MSNNEGYDIGMSNNKRSCIREWNSLYNACVPNLITEPLSDNISMMSSDETLEKQNVRLFSPLNYLNI